MYEVNGYIVQFYDMAKVQRLSAGYNIRSIEEFKEGGLPRNLYLVAMEKRDILYSPTVPTISRID